MELELELELGATAGTVTGTGAGAGADECVYGISGNLKDKRREYVDPDSAASSQMEVNQRDKSL
ncbi:hypothetical protein [Paenibacillus ihuae]|uniref:hypothetical protein n=1 Tax=Paenibacillus ihuae TaxID=1232431 RepID=UPI0006D57E01|nr:hypothetical protein [Paenibacillus ihuae]